MSHTYAPTVLQPAQVRALYDLSELHPGEPMRLDSMANPGSHGLALAWIGEQEFAIHENGETVHTTTGAVIGPMLT